MRQVPASRRAYCAVTLAAIIALAGLPAFATEPTTTPSPGNEQATPPEPPLVGLSDEVAAIRDQMDEAAARAVDLEAQIEDLDADRRALEERVAITHERIAAQRILVAEAEERLAEAEERFQNHLVETYKRGTFNPLSILLSSETLTCASRTLPFGTVLALTRGSRRVIVYVNDRGPYIAGRDLDLSKAAAAALGFSGVATVQVEVVTAVR